MIFPTKALFGNVFILNIIFISVYIQREYIQISGHLPRRQIQG